MNVQIIIDGRLQELTDEQRWALRQACAIEQHRCLSRRDNVKTKHQQEQYMRQALWLEQIANQLIQPIEDKVAS